MTPAYGIEPNTENPFTQNMASDPSSTPVLHLPKQQRFELQIDEATAHLDYTLAEQQMTIHHTFVPAKLRGQSIAGQLAQAAFDYARKSKFKVVPACSYIGVYAQRHPSLADLLAE